MNRAIPMTHCPCREHLDFSAPPVYPELGFRESHKKETVFRGHKDNGFTVTDTGSHLFRIHWRVRPPDPRPIESP